MNLLFVNKYLWCPFSDSLQYSVQVNHQLKHTSRPLQHLGVIIILQFLKDNKKFSRHFIESVE